MLLLRVGESLADYNIRNYDIKLNAVKAMKYFSAAINIYFESGILRSFQFFLMLNKG